MARRSTIDGLPEEVRRWLERALAESNFSGYQALEELLRDKGYSISKSASQVERMGLKVESSEGMLGTMQKVVSNKTGELRDVATFTTVDPLTRKPIVVSPDVGWSYNPGAASWRPELSRFGGDLAALARRELR